MSRGPARFKLTELRRAIQAASEFGYSVEVVPETGAIRCLPVDVTRKETDAASLEARMEAMLNG